MPSPFQTQADQSAMGFGQPINPAMLGSGWGIDPNLMTPSYAAPYRPQYQGSNPYAAYSRPSWAGGVNQLVNPFTRDPRWGNPVDNNSAALESVATKPVDALAWGAQRIALPSIMIGGAMNFLGPRTGSLMGDIVGSFTGQGIGGSIGRGIGHGLGTTIGGGLMGQTGGRVLGGALGALGGTAGSLLLPLAVGQAMASAADNLLIQPYIQNRRNAMNLQQNFAGISFADAQGNAISGRGLGGREAHEMASRITRAGIGDMTFSTTEYGQIADMGARAGLFDNVSSRKIVDRVKAISEQIKTIMAISKDPSIQSAIEELSKLQIGGASLTGGFHSQAGAAYRQMGMAASIAGTSVQRLMDRVGSQGQYLYQMNGMTPYMGMIAAANSYAGFANAQRTGTLGVAHLARMGGLEGATQSATSGMIAGARTPFAQMAMMNKYFYGAGGSSVPGSNMSVTGVLSTFGNNVAGDPLSAQGALMLYGNQMSERFIQDTGPNGLLQNAASMLRERGIRPQGRGGKYTAEQLAVGMRSMGLDQSQIMAILSQVAGSQGGAARAGAIKGANAQAEEQVRQLIAQEGLQGGIVGVGKDIQRSYKKFAQGASDMVEPASTFAGRATDWLSDKWDRLWNGGRLGKLSDDELRANRVSGISGDLNSLGITLKDGTYTADVKGFSQSQFSKGGRMFSRADDLASILKDASSMSSQSFASYRILAKAGGDMSSPEVRAALHDIIKNSGHKNTDEILKAISKDPEAALGQIGRGLKGSFGGTISEKDNLGGAINNYDNLLINGQAQGFLQDADALGPGGEWGGNLEKKYPELAALAKKMGVKNVGELAKTLTAQSLSTGTGQVSSLLAQHSLKDYQTNPSLLPEQFRGDFIKASNRGDTAAMKQAILRGTAYSAGGLYGTKINGAKDMDASALAKLSSTLGDSAKAKAEASADSVFDAESFKSTIGHFDGSVKIFADAVRDFAKMASGGRGSNLPVVGLDTARADRAKNAGGQ